MFFAASRQVRGWTHWQITRYFWIRGFLLLFFGRFINLLNFFRLVGKWPPFFPDPSWAIGTVSIFQVLDVLGFSMMFSALVLVITARLRTFICVKGGDWCPSISAAQVVTVLLAAGSFALSNSLLVAAQGDDPSAAVPWPRKNAMASSFSEIVSRFALFPGFYTYGVISYPLFPWVSFTLCGLAMGEHYQTDATRANVTRTSAIHSMLCFVCFIVIRSVGGVVGNLRGPGRGDSSQLNWLIAALDVCKYPPDLAYATWTTGENLMLLAMLSYWQRKVTVPPGSRVLDTLLAFGRVPLFFYLLHWFAFSAIGIVFHLSSYQVYFDLIVVPGSYLHSNLFPLQFVQGLYLPYCLLVWVPVLAVCYYLCRRYGAFKDQTTTDSLWRFL